MRFWDSARQRFEDQRQESAEALRPIEFDGYAVGGLAVGEGQEVMFDVLDYARICCPLISRATLWGLASQMILSVL